MKIFILAFVFILATMLPILFIPLFVLTVLVVFTIGPYVSTHTKWFDADKHTEGSAPQ